MSAGWSARLQRVLVLGVAASMLSVGSGFAQQQPGGTPPPGGAEPGVPPGTQQENPPDTRPGPPFELEAGYALTNVARNIHGIGTATNAGVVGLDDEGCCWKLADFPDKREILPYNVTLTGQNFTGAGCTVDEKTAEVRAQSAERWCRSARRRRLAR